MSEIPSVRCAVCDSVDKWKNVDQYRNKPAGMCLCTKCGFISYPAVLAKQKELKEYYEEEYREAPSHANLCAGERKLHYHGAFLKPIFEEWKRTGFTNPAICEVGAAFGMFLNWARQIFPGGTYTGTELTKSFVRNAYHLYGFQLTDKFDTSKKYDLITSYKVAEHMPDVDKELANYSKCLTENGRLYISVPIWFDHLNNFGMGGFTLEYYYHTNHINVWSKTLFESILAKAGFEIVSENHTYYDGTYLCKVSKTGKAVDFEDPAEIEKKLAVVKSAGDAYELGQYQKAIEAYPNFPDAHSGYYEANRAAFHKHGFEWIKENVIEKALKACPTSSYVRTISADLCMRYSQWELAIRYFSESLDMKPNEPNVLFALAHCYRNMANVVPDQATKNRFMTEARNACQFVRGISMQSQAEATTWVMLDNSKIPTPFEEQPKTAKTPPPSETI